MFDIKNVGIISSPSICNGGQGRLLFRCPGSDSNTKSSVVYTAPDSKSISPMMILRDKIPWKGFNYGVICHQIKLRLNSALIFTVTAMSEGQFALLEGCLCLLGPMIIVLHLFLAQYFKPLIFYISSFTVAIPLWYSSKHCKANNDVFSILWHQFCVLFPLLGVLVAMIIGRTVGKKWELLSLLWDAWRLSCKSGGWCRSNAWRCKLSSPRVLYLISRLVVHEVSGDCTRWNLGRFVFVN